MTTHDSNSAPDAQLALEIAGLSKAFGGTPALRDVDLQLGWGEALALFGHNGAGKSTLIRTLVTLVRPDEGTVTIAGFDRVRQAAQVRSMVGYVGHQSLLYDDMTARENLRFYAKLYGIADADRRVERSLAEVGATSFANRRMRVLSNGMVKRVAIARALLHRPRVLLLDEPEAGLDQGGLELLDSVINAVKAGGASVVMSTHSIERGFALADHVLVLDTGRVALAGATADTSVEEVRRAVLGTRQAAS